MRRLVPLLAVSALFALGLAVPAPPAAAQGAVGCQGLFPDTEFDTRAEAGPVVVYGSGIHPDMTARFAGEYANVVAWVEADIASLAGVEVCLFEDKIPLDAQALGWPEGVYLRAAAFGEQGLVALSALNVGVVGDAGKAGLIHIALWRASGGTYPQPFGDDVMGWYLGRDAGATEAIHSLYLRQQIGLREPWPPFPWTVSKISDPILWHPDFGRGGSGDFTAYVAAARGAAFLAAPSPDELATLDEGWRQALFDESSAIPGGSRTWIGGVIAAAVLLAAAIAFAWLGRASRLRAEAAVLQLATAPAAPAAAAEDGGAAVRPLVGGGPGRRHSRVGGTGAGAVGRHGDDRDRAPTGGEGGAGRDRVAPPAKPGDEIFRHPGFHDEG